MRHGEPKFKDSRGTEIVTGQTVAFNLGGDVAIGVVIAITWNCFKIELLHQAAGQYPGHISRVKRSTSLIVLIQGDYLWPVNS